jgi:hypothetical protein
LFLIFIRNAHLKTFEYTSRNKVPMCFQQFKLVSVHASQVSGVTGLWHHTQFLLVKMESCELFAWIDLEVWFSLPPPLK